MSHLTKAASGTLGDAAQQAYGRLVDLASRGVCLMALSTERARQRRALAELNDAMLKDIGITRRQARQECATPFWR